MQLILRYSKQEPYPGIQTVIAGSQTYILYYGAAELNYISYCTYEEWMEQPGTIGRAFPGVRVEEKEGLLYVTTPYGIEGLSFPFTLGDRGHLEGKLIFFDGRRTDVINRGGFKIDVVAMEQRILAVPGVEQVAVVGVDDDWRGQEPVAFVVGNSLTKPSILHNFQPEERPKDVVFLDELPLTDCSKIDKQSLKKWYNKHMSMTPN